jgi:hypothetical protein
MQMKINEEQINNDKYLMCFQNCVLAKIYQAFNYSSFYLTVFCDYVLDQALNCVFLGTRNFKY